MPGPHRNHYSAGRRGWRVRADPTGQRRLAGDRDPRGSHARVADSHGVDGGRHDPSGYRVVDRGDEHGGGYRGADCVACDRSAAGAAGDCNGRGIADLLARQRRRLLAGEGVLPYERRADDEDLVNLRDHHLGIGADPDAGSVTGCLRRARPPLAIAQEDEGNSDGDQQDSEPALTADALVEEGEAAEGSGDVAEGSYRNYKAYVVNGERTQQGEEGGRHHAHADPHPGKAQGSEDDFRDLDGVKAGGFADFLHGARDAEFAAGSGDDDQGKENELLQAGSAPSFMDWVVLGSVRPTTKTPRQMTAIPAQRSGETRSPSMR